MLFTSRIRRSVFRILLFGLAAALAATFGGWGLERVRLGATDADAFARLQQQITAQFAQASSTLERMVRAVAARRELLLEAADEQPRALFDAVDDAIGREGGDADLALTVYSQDNQPLAWSGRPSELIAERVAGPPAFFAARGPLGLRLVYVEPVVDAQGRRVGSVAAERLLSARRGFGNAIDEPFTLVTGAGPVSLRTRSEGAGEARGPDAFLIRSPRGDVLLEARIAQTDLARVRQRSRDLRTAAALAAAALALLLLVGPLLDVRGDRRHASAYPVATAGVMACLAGAWLLLQSAGRHAVSLGGLFAPMASASAGRVLRSPFDLLLAGLGLVALVMVAYGATEQWRLRRPRRRRAVTLALPVLLRFLVTQVAAAATFAALLIAYQSLLRGAFERTGLDILRFSVHPFAAPRLVVAVGVVLFHAAVLWLGVLLFRLVLMPWRWAHTWRAAAAPAAIWLTAFAAFAAVGVEAGSVLPWGATSLAFVSVVVAGAASRYVLPRFRHASQGLRLVLGFLALLLPTVVLYPSLVSFADQDKRRVIESDFGPQVMNQRDEVQARLQYAMDQIDRMGDLASFVEQAPPANGAAPKIYLAFSVWMRTDLARYRVASAVELYAADGSLISRFALNLPEYKSNQPWIERGCDWGIPYEEVSPIGSEERTLLKAGRAVCVPRAARAPAGAASGQRSPDGAPGIVGSVVVRVMLDYSALPFLSSQSPYYELLRPVEQRRRDDVPGGDVDLTVYGWSRMPTYTSASVAWPLDAETFKRIYASRQPFWARVDSGGTSHEVYFRNDRGGLYALGYPTVPPIGHLVNLAEFATLVGLAYVVMLGGSSVFTFLSGHRASGGREILREIRASFYRKLFLAFVAVSVVPVITLALIAQAYIAGRLQADTEAAAVKTADVAQRVVQDYGTQQQQLTGGATTGTPDPALQRETMTPTDDFMVLLGRRVIGQAVNIFVGPTLVATSERDLFESQLLPTRTPADVYRAIVLDRRSSFVGQERSGEFPYMLAAAPVRMGDRYAILTIPLMLRQQEIEREIDDLNRRIVLATLLFILIGAGIGYPMAERIADPVNRLTRATRRIARGELDVRIAATSSDELRRLVEAFNSMAADLQSQRDQLERTHRLEAWAEMARQVAHEIKNPLTPIQLSAEHLQRVHADRGRPLSPVLDDCVASILTQVRLLRQISAEFSSFASSPTPRPARTSLADLVEEVIGPYRSGLSGRIAITTDVPPALPAVFVDRTLIGRALTNVVENALHAMPGNGDLSIRGSLPPDATDGPREVELSVTDTGVGMDEDALERLFEPYFSTKATGTGLGLAIAKRNLTLNGGTIRVESRKGQGTTVIMRLPVEEAVTLS